MHTVRLKENSVTDVDGLEALYGTASDRSLKKVCSRMTPAYRQWIEASRFLVMSTVGNSGTDGSPRGDSEPVVRIGDEKTLLLPDWRGNNRLDSLRNIVENGNISLMFMIAGCDNVVRVNGNAFLSIDDSLKRAFASKETLPKTVIVVTIEEIYFQCAKALMRSELWSGHTDLPSDLPTAGAFLKEAQVAEDFDGEAYDKTYPEYAKTKMW